MKRFIFLLALSYLAAASSASAATIRINYPKVELELLPGETYSGEIMTENPTEKDLGLKVYLQDWVYNPAGDGEKTFTPVGSTPLSASAWISFNPAETVVPPFGRAPVRYTIRVPQDAKGGYYSVFFFETVLGVQTDEEGASVLVAGRVGSLFFIDVKGTVDRKGEIKSVEVQPPSGNKPVEIQTVFKNSGNTCVVVGGNFLIMDEEGNIKGRGELNKLYTFPGSEVTGSTQWVGRLEKGTYDVVLTYDMGKGQNVVEERKLNVTE